MIDILSMSIQNNTENLTVKQASRILGVSTSTLRRYEGQGLIKSIRNVSNNHRIYKKADVIDLGKRISVDSYKTTISDYGAGSQGFGGNRSFDGNSVEDFDQNSESKVSHKDDQYKALDKNNSSKNLFKLLGVASFLILFAICFFLLRMQSTKSDQFFSDIDSLNKNNETFATELKKLQSIYNKNEAGESDLDRVLSVADQNEGAVRSTDGDGFGGGGGDGASGDGNGNGDGNGGGINGTGLSNVDFGATGANGVNSINSINGVKNLIKIFNLATYGLDTIDAKNRLTIDRGHYHDIDGFLGIGSLAQFFKETYYSEDAEFYKKVNIRELFVKKDATINENLTVDKDMVVKDDLKVSGMSKFGGLAKFKKGIEISNTDKNALSIGGVGLGDDTGVSGASLVGVNTSEFISTSATDLQTVLSDLDKAIGGSGTGNISAVGDVTFGGAFTESGGGQKLWFHNGGYTGELSLGGLTDNRTYVLPNASGEISLLGQSIELNSSEVTGTLSTTNGGTGHSTYGIGDLLYGGAGNTLNKLAIGGNGYILTSNGSQPQWTDLDLLLLPPGSIGETLRHDGTNWIANSLIYNDGTNIGIGTTNPTGMLHLAYSQENGPFRPVTFSPQGTPSIYTLLYFSGGTMPAGSLMAVSNYGYSDPPYHLYYKSGLNAHPTRLDLWESPLSLDSNTNIYYIRGNVGIGTTGPSQSLDIDGQIRIRGGSPGVNKVLTSDANGVGTWTDSTALPVSVRWDQILNPTADKTFSMGTNLTAFNWATGTGANNLFSLTSDNSANGIGSLLNIQTGTSSTLSPLRVRAGSIEGLFVGASGNVGIGTTSPNYALDIVGTLRTTQLITPYDQTVTVAKSGGDYTTVAGALASITDAAAAKRYLIKVMPGVYTGGFTMKEYVDLQGSGIDVTTFTGNIFAASYSTVSDFTMSISGAVAWLGGYDAFSGAVANPTTIKNAKIYMNTSTGPIYPLLTKTGSYMIAENVIIDATAPPNSGGGLFAITNNAGGGSYDKLNVKLTMSAGSGTQDAIGIVDSYWSGTPTITNSTFTLVNNATSNNVADSLFWAKSSNSFVIKNTTVTYTGSNKSAYLVRSVSSSNVTLDGATVTMTAGSPSGFLHGLDSSGVSTIEKSKITLVKNNSGTAYGTNTSHSSTKIANSEIYVTTNGSGGVAYALNIVGASPNIHNNIFSATGTGGATAYGAYIQTSTCNPTLSNNIMTGTTNGLYIGTGCSPTLSFNRYNSISNNETVTGISGDTSGNLNISGRVLSLGAGHSYIMGNIGIGTTLPDSKLAVLANAADNFAASFYNSGNDANRYGISVQSGTDDGSGTNILVRFLDGDGTSIGDIKHTSGTITYESFTGTHLATIPSSINNQGGYTFGTVMCIDSVVNNPDARMQPEYYVSACESPYDSKIIGIYGFKDDTKPNKHSIFAVGDGYALVTDENGSISVGDMITSSNLKGYGMKSLNPGTIVGSATSNWNPTTQSIGQKTLPNGQTVRYGMVAVYYYPGTYYSGEFAASLSNEVVSLRSGLTSSTNRLANTETEIASMNSQIATMQSEMNSLRDALDELRSNSSNANNTNSTGNTNANDANPDGTNTGNNNQTNTDMQNETQNTPNDDQNTPDNTNENDNNNENPLDNNLITLNSDDLNSSYQIPDGWTLLDYETTDEEGNTSTESKLSTDLETLFYKGVNIFGKLTAKNINATESISVGLITINSLDNSINSIGDKLLIQSEYGAGDIDIFSGKIILTKEGSINIEGDLFAKGNIESQGNVITQGNVEAQGNVITQGNIEAHGDVATQGNIESQGNVIAAGFTIVNNDDLNKTAGKTTIPAGQTTAIVETLVLTEESLIFVTPEEPTPVSARQVGPDQLEIKLNNVRDRDLVVNWWIVNQKIISD